MKKKKSNSLLRKIGKKVLHAVLLLIKPFIPYIILFLAIFFLIIFIIDAVFVQLANDIDDLGIKEKEIQSYCEGIADINYEVYVDGKKSNEEIEVSQEETKKSITWEQIYTLLVFHNICDNKEMTNDLAKEIANSFKSKYYYKTSTIIVEEKITDEEGNERWEKVSETQVKLITESITISGHYKYSYSTETKVEGNTRTTKEILKSSVLVDEEFSLLRDYLKNKLKVSDKNLELDTQIVVQASNGLKDGTTNLQWLNENNINFENYSNYGTKWPVPGYTYLSSPYGYRTHPITRTKR